MTIDPSLDLPIREAEHAALLALGLDPVPQLLRAYRAGVRDGSMPPHPAGLPDDQVRPWIELRDTGLLWLMNRVVFHPRGFALAIAADGSGWQMLGDGSEVWVFTGVHEVRPFEAVKAFLRDGERRGGDAG